MNVLRLPEADGRDFRSETGLKDSPGGLERRPEPADEAGGFLDLPRGVEGDEAGEHLLFREGLGEVGPAVYFGDGDGAAEMGKGRNVLVLV